MASRPDRLDRRSRRLRGRDYARRGSYFVTVCVQGKAHLFGRVVHGRMRLNAAGRMVRGVWAELEGRFAAVRTGTFVVMPNHAHGIVHMTGPGAPTLGRVMHRFKGTTTRRYADGVKARGWARFAGRLWQRNYHDRILRDWEEVLLAERYIRMNPAMWRRDAFHPG